MHGIIAERLGHSDTIERNGTGPSLNEISSDVPVTVLVAEDNRTNRMVVSKMLKDEPVDLHFAEDGELAVKMFESLAPDLIFMDLSMPKVGGLEAARTIREIEWETGMSGVPIVALTANAMEGDREQCLDAGMNDYLTKPIRKQSLIGKINEYRLQAHARSAGAPDAQTGEPTIARVVAEVRCPARQSGLKQFQIGSRAPVPPNRSALLCPLRGTDHDDAIVPVDGI